MDAPPLTCELVDRDDIDHRYLAGQLPPDEADSFEQHFFGCERCWMLVERGLALRATAAAEQRVPNVRSVAPGKQSPAVMHRERWWAGLAAASAVLISAAVWYSRSTVAPNGARDGLDAVRGSDATVAALASVRGDSIFARWHRVSTAADYRVRISAADGSALIEREVTDSAVTIPRSALRAATAGTLYLSVVARDALRRPVAQSALTPLVLERR